MTIGDALAEARRQAGLTAAQVGHHTGIRETIITAIEGDDYSACGGDSYARGYIRSIAGAVGADPEPLIRVYNMTQPRSQPTTDDTADPVTGMAEWVWRAWVAVVLVVMGGLWFAAFQYLGPRHAVTTSASARDYPVAHRLPRHSQAPLAPHTRATPSVPPATPLAPVSAAAFGPGGTAQGDNPQNARLALDGNPATPWHTSWYATGHFGNLRTGTGLLLDLGRPVMVTSAQITLGSVPGADIELRAGDVPALADLQTVARMTNAGGVVQLRPTGSVRGRYLLIWFTVLPLDPAGTFQASVYSIRLEGRPG
jgi:Helix-turn-helix domain